MNNKFFVPFETARALKEKGYPQESDYMYCDGERHWRHLTLYQMNKINAVASPTYHEVVDWLEEKGIYVTTCIDMLEVCGSGKIKWGCFIFPFGGKETSIGGKHNREEALNEAIKEALEML